jgi:flagella basal body P-ring formation protein FlgA
MRLPLLLLVATRLVAIAAAVAVALTVAAPLAHAQGPVGQPVASRDLARGVVLTRDDIECDSTASTSAMRLVGWGTRRLVRKGEPLREPAVAPPVLVTAGSSVTVRATVGGVTATRDGTAMAGGALGERVRVRLDTQRYITGTVAGPATVHIP